VAGAILQPDQELVESGMKTIIEILNLLDVSNFVWMKITENLQDASGLVEYLLKYEGLSQNWRNHLLEYDLCHSFTKKMSFESDASQIVILTNKMREDKGLHFLRINHRLQKTAQEYAKYMAQFGRYGHAADGRVPSERVKQNGYQYCLIMENISKQTVPIGESEDIAVKLMNSWKSSTPHLNNILDPDILDIGIGIAISASQDTYFIVQLLARPASDRIKFVILSKADEETEYTIGKELFVLAAGAARTHLLCRSTSVQVGEKSVLPKESSIILIEKESLRIFEKPLEL
jgi:uncharacterized protein YkwD